MTISLSFEMLMCQHVFLSCLLETERQDNEHFFLFWPIEDVGHVESVLWKISDGFPYWLHIQWRGRAPWQFFGGTASHLLTHLVCLLGILQSPSLLLQHNGLFQLNSINSSYLFCSLSQMWQFEAKAVAHAGELHTVENLCLEIWNY